MSTPHTAHQGYRGNRDAVSALIRPDQVHRDLYLSEELFALEQEHFFANTWNYIGHDSQLPHAGDYISVDIAGQPLMAVRQSDRSVRVMMNRCAHKGSRLVNAACGNTGKFFRCPYHAWTYKTDGSLLAIPLKNGYDGTEFAQCEASKGLTQVKHVRLYRGFIFVKLNDTGPDFDESAEALLRKPAEQLGESFTVRSRHSSKPEHRQFSLAQDPDPRRFQILAGTAFHDIRGDRRVKILPRLLKRCRREKKNQQQKHNIDHRRHRRATARRSSRIACR